MEKFNSDDKKLSSKLVVLVFYPLFYNIFLSMALWWRQSWTVGLPDRNYQQVSGCYFTKIPSNATIKQETDGCRHGRAQVGAGERLFLLLWSSMFLAHIFTANNWDAKPCSDTLALNGQPAEATPVNLAALSILPKGVLGWTSQWDTCRWKKNQMAALSSLLCIHMGHCPKSWKSSRTELEKQEAPQQSVLPNLPWYLFPPCKTRSVPVDRTLVRSYHSHRKDKRACKRQGNPISLHKALKRFELQSLVQL